MNPFIKPIPFSRPSITRREIKAVNRVLRSGWLTSGEENIQFEKEFSNILQSPYTLSVNSATSGLHLAVECLGLNRGDRVIVPAYTFTATAEILAYCGLKPVIVDIGEDYNISPEEIQKAVEVWGSSVKAVIAVHLAGLSCRMKEIQEVACKAGLYIIEDCAHAFPVHTTQGMLGTIGDIGVFSFYANKTLTTGEGGMITCRDACHYERMKLMRLHGIDRDVWSRFSKGAARNSWNYDVIEAGFKYNLTNFQAALGRVQLNRVLSMRDRRRKIASGYRSALESYTCWTLPPDGEDHCWHLFILEMKNEKLRDSLMDWLFENNIGCSMHYIPLPALSYYRDSLGLDIQDYPVSLRKSCCSLSLPLYPDMSKRDINRVLKVLTSWGENNG